MEIGKAHPKETTFNQHGRPSAKRECVECQRPMVNGRCPKCGRK